MDENGSQKIEDTAMITLPDESAPKTLDTTIPAKSVPAEIAEQAAPVDPKPTNGNGVKPDADEAPITSSKRRLSDDSQIADDKSTKRHKFDGVPSTAAELNDEEEDELLKEISKVTDDDKVGGEQNGKANGKEDDLLARISEIETPPRHKTEDAAPSDSDDLLDRLEASDDAAISKEVMETEPLKVAVEVPSENLESQPDESPVTTANEAVPDATLAVSEIPKETTAEPEVEAPKDEEVKDVELPAADKEDEEASLLDTEEITPIEAESIDEISAEIETASHEADALLAIPMTDPVKPPTTAENTTDEAKPQESEPQSIEATLEAMEASVDVDENPAVESSEQTKATEDEAGEKTEPSNREDTLPMAAEAINELTSVLEDDDEKAPKASDEPPTNGLTQTDEEVAREASPMPSLAVSLDDSGLETEKDYMEVAEKTEVSEGISSTGADADEPVEKAPPKDDNDITDAAMPTIQEEVKEKPTEENEAASADENKQPDAVVDEPTEASTTLATTTESVEEKGDEAPPIEIEKTNEATAAEKQPNEAVPAEDPKNEAPAAEEPQPEKIISSEDDTEPMDVDDELPPVESGTSMDASDLDVKPVDKSMDECSSTTNSEEALKNTPKPLANLLQAKVDEHDSATPNSNNVSTSNLTVFNSTPIMPKPKPFAMSTENVSKIDESSSEIEIGGADDEKVEAVQPPKGEEVVGGNVTSNTDSEVTKSTDLSEVEGTSASETDSKNMSVLAKCTSSSSSGTCSRFLETCRQINGIDSTMDDSGDDVKVPTSVVENLDQLKIQSSQQSLQNGLNIKEEPNAVSSNDTAVSTLNADEMPCYEVNVWLEDQGIKSLSVEKVDGHLHSLSSDAASSRNYSSSNGSVSSFGPFALPGPRHSNVSSTNSSSTDNNFAVPSMPKRMRHVVKGTAALYDYMIEYFTKCRCAMEDPNNESGVSTIKLENVTPPKRKSVDRRGAATKKRTLSPSRSESEDEEKLRAKQFKKSPGVSKPSTPTVAVVPDDLSPEDLEKIGQCCLARWSDRKYYAGRIEQIRTNDKKIVVRFEDGATKALNPDLVIVGREDFLPLMDQAVHALTTDDTYEPGLVTSMMRDDNDQIVYTVLIVTGEIMVSPTNIYLTDDQAKMIQAAQKKSAESRGEVDSTNMQSPVGGRRVVRRSSKSETPDMGQPGEAATKAGRSLRNRRAADKSVNESPEAGYSGGVHAEGKRGRRPNKRNAIQPSRSESSDISETFEDSAPNSPESGLEAIDGVQPELQKVPKETELIKMNVIAEYLGNDKNKSLEEILGPIPSSKTLFRNKHFILTCTIPIKGSKEASPAADNNDATEPADSMTNRLKKFATLPFVKEHLKNQIEAGGGKVYQHFEDIPKGKYKQCKLIAPHPCVTAKFVQCLAVDIPAVSHEWIIECCHKLTVLDVKPFLLPSGWSILQNRYIKWAVGRGAEQRSCINPFFNSNVLLASQNKEFTEFWSRVCKFAGATIRLIKSESDITANLTGYMLTDQEFPDEIKLEAQRKGIPVVSSVWAVQSLILGKICQPTAHEKLTQIYQDDDF